MTLNFNQLQSLMNTLNSLKEEKLPFKLSLIIAKDLSVLQKEFDFYSEQEKEFALKYVEFDDNGQPVAVEGGMFKIKPGLEAECMEARKTLNEFTCDVELKKIPVADIEHMEFTPAQVEGLELVLEEE